MKGWSFEARISRAAELAKTHPAARELLTFYGKLAAFQKPVYEDLQSCAQSDVRALMRYFPELIDLVCRSGPEPLAEFGATHLSTEDSRLELLLTSWERDAESTHALGEERRFYARVLLQPFAEHLAARGSIGSEATVPTCPFCSARPVAGVLRGEGEGAKRSLLCSLCSTEWLFRRVLCPNCGNEEKDALPAYTSEDFPLVRVEACDRCKTYIKSVDLTKDGLAVPIADELATVALSVWAEDHGYTKLESNLLGL
jgi:FdhE protein